MLTCAALRETSCWGGGEDLLGGLRVGWEGKEGGGMDTAVVMEDTSVVMGDTALVMGDTALVMESTKGVATAMSVSSLLL